MPHCRSGFETIIASPYDYEELVAEMYLDGKYIGQVIKEKGEHQMEIEFGDPKAVPEAICRRADLDGFLECVQTARDRLAGRIQ